MGALWKIGTGKRRGRLRRHDIPPKRGEGCTQKHHLTAYRGKRGSQEEKGKKEGLQRKKKKGNRRNKGKNKIGHKKERGQRKKIQHTGTASGHISGPIDGAPGSRKRGWRRIYVFRSRPYQIGKQM